MSTALAEGIYVCWLRLDCFTSHPRLPLEIIPMLESPESDAKSRDLAFDLDRELSEWLARLEPFWRCPVSQA
jgi:hypothetical protein